MSEQPIIRPPWIETPLVESANLSKAAGCRVFLKLENLQPAGSFKSRGPGSIVYQHAVRLQKVSSPKTAHFYSSSGGNAGLAVVTSATSLGYSSTIVVPNTTKPRVIAQLRAAGATDVFQHGESWFYADQHLREVVLPEARKRGAEAVYCHPFDDELIFQGNSTIISEIKRQLPSQFDVTAPPSAVICSVGGGGLFTGIQDGLQATPQGSSESWSSIPLLALETDGAQSLHESLAANSLITLPAITSIATSLGAVRVAPRCLSSAQLPNVKSLVLSDAEAARAVYRFADDQRMLVEPACGVALAVCYQREVLKRGLGREVRGDDVVVVVVCGGTGVTSESVEGYRAEYGPPPAEEGGRGGDVPSLHTLPNGK